MPQVATCKAVQGYFILVGRKARHVLHSCPCVSTVNDVTGLVLAAVFQQEAKAKPFPELTKCFNTGSLKSLTLKSLTHHRAQRLQPWHHSGTHPCCMQDTPAHLSALLGPPLLRDNTALLV